MRVPLGAAFAAIMFAAAACSPDAAPEGQPQAAPGKASTIPANTAVALPAPAPEPVRPAAIAAKAARRCGWLSNPTPANWWLTDSEGEWILATQGADQAPGMDEMPDMSTAGWVETNGHYGYGCACMTITVDGEGKVTRIEDAAPKPLKQCKADRNLPKPE